MEPPTFQAVQGLPQVLNGYSANASDLVKIAIVFGGYDRKQLLMRCALRQRNGERNINIQTVCAVLDEMLDEQRAVDAILGRGCASGVEL